MEEHILSEVKQLSGIYEDSTAFDRNIVLYINSTISRLRQLGVQIDSTFYLVANDQSIWGDYIKDINLLPLVKDYVVTKVILKFNPPASGTLIDELHKHISELEFSILNITDFALKVGG